MHPDGFMCLVCQTRTKNEGQVCDECVEKGHRRENDTVLMNLSYYTVPTPGTRFTLLMPVEDEGPES